MHSLSNIGKSKKIASVQALSQVSKRHGNAPDLKTTDLHVSVEKTTKTTGHPSGKRQKTGSKTVGNGNWGRLELFNMTCFAVKSFFFFRLSSIVRNARLNVDKLRIEWDLGFHYESDLTRLLCI